MDYGRGQLLVITRPGVRPGSCCLRWRIKFLEHKRSKTSYSVAMFSL